MIHRSPEIPFLGFLGREAAEAGPPYGFAYGRTALREGLRMLGVEAGGEILAPQFICHSVLDPVFELGLCPVLYEVAEGLGPVWKDLEARISPRTRAVIMVHYFGVPQDISAFREFCERKRIFLIEDNAHGFGGRLEGRLLGTFGDIGISSPRKSFPVINGAVLYSRVKAPPPPPFPLEPIKLLWRSFKSSSRRVIESSEVLRKALIRPKDYASQEAFRDDHTGHFAMDRKTADFLEAQDLELCRSRRQACYHVWESWASRQAGLRPVFDSIPEGCMPLAFPALCASAKESGNCFDWGHEHGIDVFSWPTLPREVVDGRARAMGLWERLACFPVHQDISPGLLEARLSALRSP